MIFSRPLEQAIFLKRKSANIIEADTGVVKIDILCPNNSTLQNCAVLGSRIWYSPAELLPFYIPATWQIAEIDYGNLVIVNNYLCQDLFREGFNNGIIKIADLQTSVSTFCLMPDQSLPGGYTYDFNLQSAEQSCYVIVNSSTFNLEEETNYFPESNYLDARYELFNLIHAKMLGHRAILCCFILNNGINNLTFTAKYNKEYAELLYKALELGVEFIGYSTRTNYHGIEVLDDIVINK